jgi:HlyD family secretion protein
MTMRLVPVAQALLRRLLERPLLFAAVALAALAAGLGLFKAARPPTAKSACHEVKRADLLISIVEGGTLEAVNEQIVRSEVEGIARIIFIVKEGVTVKKGDLLVELDSSSTADAVNLQQITVEKAQFAFVQAQEQLEITKSVVESDVQAADLKLEFARADLEKYVKGEALQARRNAEIDITNVVENLKIDQERLDWTRKLYEKNYETKANLDKDELSVSQTKLKLEQARQALWLLTTFDEPKKKRTLEAAAQEAKENLERVKLQGDRKIEQCKADLQTQKSTLDLSKKKLERDLKQLAGTKIFAPQDGLVVYSGLGGRFSSESMIEEGAVVRYRQELIKLPDVTEMKIAVKIHETYINQVQLGQPAYVVLDAMPDQRFRGEVTKVAPLPDSMSRWSNPNLKVYATEIVVTDKLPNVKPGVSARAEIIVTNLQGVLAVPIQAVTTLKGKQVVYLDESPPRPVPITVGLYNLKFIEIASGLKERDRVLLSPPFDTEEKDLAGSIIGNGDKLPTPNSTNGPARGGGRRGGKGRKNGPDDLRAPTPPDRGGGLTAEPTGRGPDSAGPIPDAMLKRFDKDGDGRLNEEERAAMRAWLAQNTRSDTNAVPGRMPGGIQTPARTNGLP